jgi:hypothetical protein
MRAALALAHTLTHTSLQLGYKHENAAAALSYTYQTHTAKPVFMADSAVSVTELIHAGHAVAVPHVVELRRHSSS